MTPDHDVLVLAEMRDRFPIAAWTLPPHRRGIVEGLISPATVPHCQQAEKVVRDLGNSGPGWTFRQREGYAPGFWSAEATGRWKGVEVILRATLPIPQQALPPAPAPAPLLDQPAEQAVEPHDTGSKRWRRGKRGQHPGPVATATPGEDGPPTQTMGAIA